MKARRPTSWRRLLLVSWLAVGCGASEVSHFVAAKNYDRACASVADCFAIYEGSACCGAGCPNAAIRQDAFAKYMRDFAAASMCNPAPPCPVDLPRCMDARVACVAGVCQLETTDAATE